MNSFQSSRTWLLVATASILLACGKDKAPARNQAPPATGLPPLAAGEIKAPSPHGANLHGGGMPPATVGDPATPGGIPFDEKSIIVGSLAVPPGIKDKIQPGDTIFLVVRRAVEGPTPGPILAVKRLEAKTFPQPFSVDGRDAMMPGTALAGKVIVTVRVDKDSNATTKNPGDVVGTSTVLEPPAKQVIITLDKVL